MQISEFWTMTPWVFRQCVEAYADAEEDRVRLTMSGAWMTAALGRVQKLPKLQEFLNSDPKPEMTPEEEAQAMMGFFDMHNRSLAAAEQRKKGVK